MRNATFSEKAMLVIAVLIPLLIACVIMHAITGH